MNRILRYLYIKDWRSYIAEFLGTFVFVFISCGVVLSDIFYGDVGKLAIALTSGFSYSALVFGTVHLSRGFLNPAVTIALWLAQKLEGTKAVFYILVQLLASLVAAASLFYLFGQNSLNVGLGGPILGINVSAQVAVLIEAVGTAILTFMVFATMVDRGGPVSFGPLVLGLSVTALTVFALPITGAAFNPARAIGPALLSNNLDSLAIYLVGPAAGALFGIIYEFLFLKKFKKS